MKSLKRTLSLVLVLVMVLGLFGVASAAFTDEAKIQYKVPVGVMTGMKAINGYPDGSFNPTGNITRAEAAKLVAYTVLGAKTAAGLTGVTSRFTDVGADYAWAIPSIEYLASRNIINGIGGGLFDPDGLVTGYELGKMLLVAIGYGAKNEYVGDSWSLNVAIDGGKRGIFDGRVDGANKLSAAASREEAALYCYNALGVPMVEYSNLLGSYVPVDLMEEKETTIGMNVYGFSAENTVEKEVTILSNAAVNTALMANARTKTPERTTVSGSTTYAFSSGIDDIGRVVNVYYGTKGTSTEVFYVETVSTDVTTTATTTAKAFKASLDALNATVVNGANIYQNGIDTTSDVDSFTVGTTAPGAATYVVFDGQVVSKINPEVYYVEKITDYKAPTATANGYVNISGVAANGTVDTTPARITLNKTSSTDPNAVVLYDGVAKGDYVYVGKYGNLPTVVTKGNSVYGNMTAFTTDKSAVIGGTTYPLSAVDNNITLVAPAVGQISATTSRMYVLDKAGAVVGYDSAYTPASIADTYGVVLATDSKNGVAPSVNNGFKGEPASASFYIALPTGEKVVYTMNSTDKTEVGETSGEEFLESLEATTGDIINFAVSGTTLTALEVVEFTTPDLSGTAITKGSTLVTDIASGYYLTSNTAILYWNPADATFSVTAVTGYNNAVSKTATVKCVADPATKQIIFAYVGGAVESESKAYAFVPLNAPSTTKYDETLKANVSGYAAYVDGAPTVLWAKANDVATINAALDDNDAHNVFAITMTDGYLTAVAPSGAATASTGITFVDANNVVFDNTTQRTYANAQVIVVENAGTAAMTVTNNGASVSPNLIAETEDLIYYIDTVPATTPASVSYIYIFVGAGAAQS